VLDVTPAAVQRRDFIWIDVQADDVFPVSGKLKSKRQSDVTKPDNGDFHF